MQKVAFICPLYDMRNHFDFGIQLAQSKTEYQINGDLIFIFSNEEQRRRFAERLKNECPQVNAILDLMPDEFLQYKAQAVAKKLYGLRTFMNSYRYIILADSEAKFIRRFDAEALADEIWRSKSVLASNLSPDGFFIMRKCYKAMGLYYNRKLRRALGGYKYNFWFNDLQVYPCDLLPEFFEWLKQFDQAAIMNTWHCFEYYVFYAFLCLKKDIPIKRFNYLSPGGINEYMDEFPAGKQNRIIQKMNLHWTSSQEVKSEQIVMLFHLDRDKAKGNYGYSVFKPWRLFKLIVKRYLVLIKEVPEYIRNIS